MKDAKFRLDHLGYSINETKIKFEKQVEQWKRTTDFVLDFDDLYKIITEIDLEYLSDNKLASNDPYINNFYEWLEYTINSSQTYLDKCSLLKKNNEDFYDGLEDFLLIKLDRNIILRLFCENPSNLKYELNWFCYDIVENGWASIEDIEYFDDKFFVLIHNKLFGKLHHHLIQNNLAKQSINSIDNWIKKFMSPEDLKEYYPFRILEPRGEPQYISIPTYVRNLIHHPENEYHTLEENDLKNSLELLLRIIKENNITL